MCLSRCVLPNFPRWIRKVISFKRGPLWCCPAFHGWVEAFFWRKVCPTLRGQCGFEPSEIIPINVDWRIVMVTPLLRLAVFQLFLLWKLLIVEGKESRSLSYRKRVIISDVYRFFTKDVMLPGRRAPARSCYDHKIVDVLWAYCSIMSFFQSGIQRSNFNILSFKTDGYNSNWKSVCFIKIWGAILVVGVS